MLLHATSDALPFLRQRVAMPSYAAPRGPGESDPPPIGDPGDDGVDDGDDDDEDENDEEDEDDEDDDDEEPLKVHSDQISALQHDGGKTAIIKPLQRFIQVV